jgi:hypothetical protein
MTMTSFLKRKKCIQTIQWGYRMSLLSIDKQRLRYNRIYIFWKDQHWTLQRRSQMYSVKTKLNHNRTWINLKWNSLNFQFLITSIYDNF